MKENTMISPHIFGLSANKAQFCRQLKTPPHQAGRHFRKCIMTYSDGKYEKK